MASGGKYHYDAASQSFYVVKGNQWISTEKPGLPPSVTRKADPPIGSLARKARFIQQQGLAGAMFWQVSDFKSDLRSLYGISNLDLPYTLARYTSPPWCQVSNSTRLE